MATNDFIGFASNGNANIMSQADYAAAAEQGIGMQPGPASSKLINKVLRQGANMAAVLGQMIADAGYNALDNGDLAVLKTALYGGLSARILAAFDAGTFAPGIFGGTVAGDFSYTIRSGNYLKIGALCFVDFSLEASVVTVPTGYIGINGFPFAAASANQSILMNLGFSTNGRATIPPVWLRVGVNPNVNIMNGINISNGTISNVNFGVLSVGDVLTLRMSGIYRTA